MTDGYKIKRVLTWVNNEEKQIYPAVYQYSYDYKGKSTTDITNAGWTIFGSGVITSNDGVTCNNGTDVTMIYPVDVSKVKKITIEANTTYRQMSATAFLFGLQLENGQYASNAVDFYLASNATYNGTKVRLNKSGTITYGTNVGSIGTSSYNPKLEIDLENKTVTGILNGYSNSTLSLSDSDVSLIKTMKYIYTYTTRGTFYIQDISITAQ